ncbi:MAG: hypothetical protein IKA72_00440 [Clostridia bacterium]|nr:hypothetical protein [Clostridia bacterium]
MSYYSKKPSTKSHVICAVSICLFVFGIWFLLSSLNEPNAIMEWCGQYYDPSTAGFGKFVFIYGVLQFSLFFLSFWGILSVFALPKLAFGLNNRVFDIFLWILAFGGALAVGIWGGSQGSAATGFGDFLLGILFFIFGVVIVTPLMLIAGYNSSFEDETDFLIKLGIQIGLLILALFLLFTAFYFIDVLFLLGLVLLFAFLGDCGYCVIIVFSN